MANLGFNLNPSTEVEGYKSGFEVIPPGWYDVVITKAEMKDTKNGAGKFIEFTYELQDGTRRTVFDRINIVNSSEKAQAIGRATLAKIAMSIGHTGELANTDVLHGRPFSVKVVVEDFESNKDAGKILKSNKVADYDAKKAGAQSAPASTGGNGKRPW